MKEKIEKIIYTQIDKINKDRPKENKIDKKISTHLTGSKTEFDSVELIGLLVSIEDKINKLFKKKIKIADEKIIEKPEKISSIGKLIDMIYNKINK